ncbi:hypothetical protein FSP39_001618 [Pinctada imbricata]|uniref:Impact N-terminal domain-containing protein n=1 Tax=Pinctada imbricata TaxID=66713 RepID=A0AA88XV64_PINIB|nr:hypothetical protein FSP39_001618 [Pinctada imbricata]
MKNKKIHNQSLIEAGNKFKGSGMPVKCINDVRKMYKKVVSDASYAGANHNVLVYRTDEEDGFCDDSEFGAGKRLLSILRQKNVKNIAVVVSRWYGGRQIGPKRFDMMEKILFDVLNELKM